MTRVVVTMRNADGRLGVVGEQAYKAGRLEPEFFLRVPIPGYERLGKHEYRLGSVLDPTVFPRCEGWFVPRPRAA